MVRLRNLLFLSLLGSILSSSCDFVNRKNLDIADDVNWTIITIVSEENTFIAIDSYSDTAKILVYHRGSFFSPSSKTQKIKIDTMLVMFTKDEKDSIFRVVSNIINKPVSKKGGCTDFVGDLELKIDYGSFDHREPGSCEKKISYSGVCNWNTLSEETMQLHSLLKRKMKNVFLGEDDDERSHIGG